MMKSLFIFCLGGLLPLMAQKLVSNGMTHQGYTLSFTEQIRFGGEDAGDDYLWSGSKADIAVTHEGTILVGDANTTEVRLYDQKGVFVRKIASKGEGPGEMRAFGSIQVLEDGRLVIFDQAAGAAPRFHFFDKNLAYLETEAPVSFATLPVTAEFSPSGEYYRGLVMSFKREEKIINSRIAIMSGFTLKKELSSFDQPMGNMQSREPKDVAFTISGFIQGAFAGVGVAIFDDKNQLYTAYSQKYEITRWSSDLKTKQLVFKREYKPIANPDTEVQAVAARISENFRRGGLLDNVTDSFLNRVVDQTDIPEAKQPIFAMISMPDGKLLVIHDLQEITGIQVADIFDDQGKYIGQVARPNWGIVSPRRVPRLIFRNNLVYALETDAQDNNTVAVYSYKLTKANK